MATSYKWPGVYAEITDLSGVVTANANTACAYVGEAEFGPVFKPTLVTNLQEYINKFGGLSSKYGYAGYSLAVAAETIDEHYFVRVVDKETARYSAAAIMQEGKGTSSTDNGYSYTEMNTAMQSRDTNGDSGLFIDEDSSENIPDMRKAFIVAAKDPNNRKFYISTADSTINENKGYAVKAVSVEDESASELTDETYVKITVDAEMVQNESKAIVLEPGEKIVMTKMKTSALNGIFEVLYVALDESNTSLANIIYIIPGKVTIDDPETELVKARVARYPAANETTFSVTISEKVGSVYQVLETFEYCTLYQARDSYGNSMFLEDVINSGSNFVQVFVNRNQTTADPDEIVIPAMVTNVALVGGASGTFTDASTKDSALSEGWELFRDRAQVSVSILMNCGYVSDSNVSYQSKMLEIANARRDCFCLFDVPMNRTDYEDAIDWRKNIQGFNSYRGAVCSPWVKTYDAINGKANFLMCPSAYMAKIMGMNDPWMAPAGLNRGILTSSIVSPTGLTQYYNATQGGNLYADNQINCYIKNPGSGYVIWGQRTLQAKPSALDRINVARTVIYIETILRDAARWHLFENNTAYERMKINLEFSAFLDTVLSADGIQKYQVVCDESNNTPQVIANNQMVIDVYLWPTYCAEVIRINTSIMGADVSVSITST